MTAKGGNPGEVSPRAVLLSLLFAGLFAVGVCLLCRMDAGRPMGVLRDWLPDETAEPPVLVESVRKEKGFLRVEGAVPGMRTKPYRLRVGLIQAEGEGNLILLHTQMVRRADLKEAYQCDDHCGFAATLSLRNLPDGTWRIALVSGAEGEESVRLTGQTVNAREGT